MPSTRWLMPVFVSNILLADRKKSMNSFLEPHGFRGPHRFLRYQSIQGMKPAGVVESQESVNSNDWRWPKWRYPLQRYNSIAHKIRTTSGVSQIRCEIIRSISDGVGMLSDDIWMRAEQRISKGSPKVSERHLTLSRRHLTMSELHPNELERYKDAIAEKRHD